MISLPDYMLPHLRAGEPLLYLVEIAPASSDSWTAFRWGEKETTVDGNTYQGGILAQKIGDITDKLDIELGGNLAVSSNLRLLLAADAIPTGWGGESLRTVLLENPVEGRKATIYVVVDPPNRLLNSSFEARSGANFDSWTEEANDGTITAVTPSAGDGAHGSSAVRLQFAAGSTGPRVRSDSATFYPGETICLSCWVKAASGTPTVTLNVLGGGGFWWDGANEVWTSAAFRFSNQYTIGTSWERIELYVPMSSWSQWGTATTLSIQAEISLYSTGGDVEVDKAQLEALNAGEAATPWQLHRTELESDALFTRYRAEVRRHRFRHAEVELELQVLRDHLETEIPATLISRAAAPAGEIWDIPPDVEGEPFPMTYGDLFFLPFGNDVAAGTAAVNRVDIGEENGVDILPFNWPRAMAMGRLVARYPNQRAGASHNGLIYFDRPGIKLHTVDRVHHYVEEMNRYLPELSTDNYPSASTYQWDKSADLARAEGASDSYVDGNRIALSVYIRPTHIGVSQVGVGYVLWTDVHCISQGNAKNGGSSNAANSVMGMQTGSGGEIARSSWQYEVLKLTDIELLEAYLIGCVRILGGAAGAAYVEFGISGTAGSLTLRIQDGAGSVNNCPWATEGTPIAPTHGETNWKFTKTDYSNRLDWWMTPTDKVGTYPPQHNKRIQGKQAANNEVFVYELALRLDCTVNLDDFRPFAAVKGREYQDTWGGRKTAGNLIENPVDIIESIFRDELGVASADIRTAALDTASTARSSWKGAGQVVAIEKAHETLEDLLFSHALAGFVDINGQETVRALDYASAPDVTLTLRDFAINSITVTHTARESIVTEFVLHYGRNPQTGDYLNQETCSHQRTSLDSLHHVLRCRTGWEELGRKTQKKEFRAPWIQDEATAKLLLAWLVSWLSRRRLRVTGTLSAAFLGLELADQAAIYEMRGYLPNSITSDARFIVEQTRVKRSPAGVGVSLLEMRDRTLPDSRKAWVTALEVGLGDASLGPANEWIFPDGDLTSDWDESTGANHYGEVAERVVDGTDDGTHIATVTINDKDRFSMGGTAKANVYYEDLRIRAMIDDPAGTAKLTVKRFMDLGAGLVQVGSTLTINGAALGGYGVLGTYIAQTAIPGWTQAQYATMEIEVEFLAS